MHEIRQALRQLRRRPGFALTIVLTLALGVGANALVFSAVRGVLLRPLPFTDSGQLVAVWETQPGISTRSVAPANFLDWRRASSFEGLAAYTTRRRSLAGDDPQRVNVATVSANFFRLLRVDAIVGRTFTSTIPPGVVREVVIREDFWEQHFGGDRTIVNTTMRIDDETLVVAGVIPADRAFPENVVAWTQAPHDVPELRAAGTDLRTVRDSWYFRVIGRMRRGVSRGQAQSELDAIAARLSEVHPATNTGAGVNVVGLHDQVTGASASMLWILTGIVGCVLAVACGNVATLLMASAIGRGRELRIRTALGASPSRLVRQLSTESLVLAFGGGALGLALAWAGRPAMLALLPEGMPRTSLIGIDGTVAAFTFVLAGMTAVLFGIAPSVLASRPGVFGALRDGGRSGRSRSASRLASFLMAAQLAVAVVLVTGTGLMLRTLATLHQRDVGIDVGRLLTLDITLPDARTRGRAAAVLDVQRIAERLAALPGVTSAAAVQTLPLASTGPSASIRVEGRTFAVNEAPDVVWKTVSSDYFRTVGASIVRGRGFAAADRDGTQPVTVINMTLAGLLWPDRDPIGTRIGTGLDGDGAPVVIVGIVADTPQEGIGATVLPEMYRPLAQPARFGVESMSFVVRTDGDPGRLSLAARQAARDVYPQAPISTPRTMADVASAGLASELTATRALAIFGGLALFLAAVGLYGVMARLVGDRTRELGVRLALGAEPRALSGLVLKQTARVSAAGLVAGGVGSFALSRHMTAWLHGVSPADPLAFAGAATVLFVAALTASYLPARRAASIDPLIVLREE